MYPEEEGRRCGKDVAGPPRVMGEADSERLCAGSEGLGSREHLEKTKCTERLVLLNVLAAVTSQQRTRVWVSGKDTGH